MEELVTGEEELGEEEEEGGWGLVWEVAYDGLFLRVFGWCEFTVSDDDMRTCEDTSSPSSGEKVSSTTT